MVFKYTWVRQNVNHIFAEIVFQAPQLALVDSELNT